MSQSQIYDKAIQIFRGMKSSKVRMTVLVRETQHDAEELALNAVAALIDEKGSEATKHLEQLTLNDKAPIAIAAIEGLLKRGELAGLAATLRESKVPNTRRLVIAKRLFRRKNSNTRRRSHSFAGHQCRPGSRQTAVENPQRVGAHSLVYARSRQ